MGIKDLLPNLKSITNRVALKDVRAASVAVDGKSWLYKAAYCCPRDIALNEEPIPSFYSYLKKCIKMLYQQGMESIVLVFDGCESAAKENENRRRHEQRLYFLEEAKKAEKQGNGQIAYKYYKRAVYISVNVVQKVLVKLAEWNVPYMIAPYEADAQLAYFGKYGFADIVITEDSDLLAYGCPKVFYKMDVNNGCGDFICYAALPSNQQLSFENWGESQFMLFCCLMGCDYHPRVPKSGVKGIHAFITRLATSAPKIDLDIALRRMFAAQGVININEAVLGLKQALLTFKYHIVYNPLTKTTEHLHPIPSELMVDQLEEIRSVVGEHIPFELVHDFIYGKIDPKEMQSFLLQGTGTGLQAHSGFEAPHAIHQPTSTVPDPRVKRICQEEKYDHHHANINEDEAFQWQYADNHNQAWDEQANTLLPHPKRHVSRLQQQALELNQSAAYHLHEAQHIIPDYQEDKLSMNKPMPAKAFISPSVAKKFHSMRRRRMAVYHDHRHRERHVHPVEAEVEVIVHKPSRSFHKPARDYPQQLLQQDEQGLCGLYREAPSKKRVVEQIYPEYQQQRTVSPLQHQGGPVWR